jgi:hypothetical protein
MGTGGSFSGIKRQGRETDHSPPASAKVKKMWIYTSTPLCHSAQLVKQRDNFTFTLTITNKKIVKRNGFAVAYVTNAVSVYITMSNGRRQVRFVENDLEGNGRGLIELLHRHLAGMTEENLKNHYDSWNRGRD